MAAPTLVENDVRTGLDITKALMNDSVLKPKAALWFFDEDSDEWRFLIATADARKRGPQAAYLRVRSILKRNGFLEKVPLRRVVVVDPSDRRVSTIGQLIRTPDGQLSSVGFYGNTVNRVPMPDMHIYLLTGDEQDTSQQKSGARAGALSYLSHSSPMILSPVPGP